MSSTDQRISSYEDFWPYYVAAHSRFLTQLIHVVGSGIGLSLFIYGCILLNPALLMFAIVCGYGLAWMSHFLIEKNRPATFQYPLWSFLADWRMAYYFLRGKMPDEVRKAKLKSQKTNPTG